MRRRRKASTKPLSELDRLAEEAYFRVAPWKCWFCGRTDGFQDRPRWFNAAWMLDRTHIVNKPRVNDRRAIIVTCRVCHEVQHGTHFADAPDWPQLDLSGMLWLKKHFDPQWYDRAWLQRHSVRRLPRAKRPKHWET